MPSMAADIHILDWNLLRSFYVIVEEGSLTRAAADFAALGRRLGRTTPLSTAEQKSTTAAEQNQASW